MTLLSSESVVALLQEATKLYVYYKSYLWPFWGHCDTHFQVQIKADKSCLYPPGDFLRLPLYVNVEMERLVTKKI